MKPTLSAISKETKSVTIEVDIPVDKADTDKYEADQYSCRPPPLFTICVTIFEFVIFAYYAATPGRDGPFAIDSPFIYRPDRRYEVWRFFMYMVLHASWIHLLFNLSVQMIVGLPLEMVHGSWRVGCIYMSGVLGGSLLTSIFNTEVSLIGASGGVYALLAAHLANVLINHKKMQFGWMRVLGVFVIAASDVGFAFYDRYMEPNGLPVSNVAHLGGALAGLTSALLLLKYYAKKFHEHFLWWTALVVYSSSMLFAILFNVFDIDALQTPMEVF